MPSREEIEEPQPQFADPIVEPVPAEEVEINSRSPELVTEVVPESEKISSAVDVADPAVEAEPVSMIEEPKTAQSISSHKRNLTRPIVPIVPIKPIVQNPPVTSPRSITVDEPLQLDTTPSASSRIPASHDSGAEPETAEYAVEQVAEPIALVEKIIPKSWAELLRSKAAAAAGAVTAPPANGTSVTNGVIAPKANSLADAVRLYDVKNENKISFLKPRGLVNTGNMCYMNSVR